MSRFRFTGWHGEMHTMTDKELLDRVRKDSQRSNYNWVASAIELTRVTGLFRFNRDYAIEIRSRVLNCFADNERSIASGLGGFATTSSEREALQVCYDFLRKTDDKKAIEACRLYLLSMINAATYSEFSFDLLGHPGNSFRNFREQWVQEKFAEYDKQDQVNIVEMNKILTLEWKKLKAEAEERGDFEEDDKQALGEIFNNIMRVPPALS